MKQFVLLLCILFAISFLTSVPTFSRPREYAYMLEETKWQEERYSAWNELKTAWKYLHRPYRGSFLPDSIVSDTIVPDSRLVNRGILHRITHIEDGKETNDFYYEDSNHYYLFVVHGVYTNCGQPWSFNEYYFINRDGLITFNTRKYIEMLLWCGNVYLSPLLWIGLLLFLLRKGILRFKEKQS